MHMTRERALSIIGGLANPRKMPCKAWGIPASMCKLGTLLANVQGSVCSQCYATRGRYHKGEVKRALERRARNMWHRQWVDAFVTVLRRAKYFRWFDSGDLQNVEQLARIVRVAERLPHVRFWLPTRELKTVQQYMRECKRPQPWPSNLTVRVSAHMVDKRPQHIARCVGSMVCSRRVPRNVFACPARKQGNVCGTCRACWDPSIRIVAYQLH